MQLTIHNKYPSVFLRAALSIPYLWFSFDRLGLLGAPGSPHVSWGDWSHFIVFASQVMSFLPEPVVNVLAGIATAAELLLGALLLVGYFTQAAAVGSGILALLFATSMAISMGIEVPLSYSVFAVSAGSFLLATIPKHEWSVDHWLYEKAVGH